MRILLFVLSLLTVLAPCTTNRAMADGTSLLRISGPPITESLPLLAMTEKERDWSQGFDAAFIPWHSPDMFRAMVVGRQIDAAIMTTASASTLYNKGINCRVVLLQESPVWIVSTKSGAGTLESLEGSLLVPFGPGEMPGLFYRATMDGAPMNVEIRHTSGALEAVNLLLAGKGDHAMLSEPSASIAIAHSKEKLASGASVLVKRVNMLEAWTRAFPGHRLASSSVSFLGPQADNSPLMGEFRKAYIKASQWVEDNPGKALELTRKHFPSLALQMERGVIAPFASEVAYGAQARKDTLFFLHRINEISPAAIGGAMPGEDFFEVGP